MGKRDKERRGIKPAAWTEQVIVATNTHPENLDMDPVKPSDSDVQATSTEETISDSKESSQKRDAVGDESNDDQETQGFEESDRKRPKLRKHRRTGIMNDFG